MTEGGIDRTCGSRYRTVEAFPVWLGDRPVRRPCDGYIITMARDYVEWRDEALYYWQPGTPRGRHP